MDKIRLAVVGCLAASVLVFAGPAAASRPTQSNLFDDCVGDGPPSFYAVRTATPPAAGASSSAGAAFELTDGSATYQVLDFDLGSSPPGVQESSSWNLMCTLTLGGITRTVYGLYVETP